ncbi:MAG: hypothetical protein QOF83_1386 [Solirubrobacteraceae bacterium]|nr:hypothetical protein [Solirubrobacteraceae bacterium]
MIPRREPLAGALTPGSAARRPSTPEPRPPDTEEATTPSSCSCCCHPDLAPASQVALTLRAVGGLTTQEIADAFFVLETTMAQRISRTKRTLRGRRLDQPGELAVVLRVLYLVYTAGHSGPPARVDLAGEAIRLARQLTLATEEPEARGLLALMLLNHARMPARLDPEGRIVTLDRQDSDLWDKGEIAEGVRVLQSALAMQTAQRRPGRYQRPPSARVPTMTPIEPSNSSLVSQNKFHAPSGRSGDQHERRRTARASPMSHSQSTTSTPSPLAREPGGAELVGEVQRYAHSFRLCHVCGPERIIVELAEQIG